MLDIRSAINRTGTKLTSMLYDDKTKGFLVGGIKNGYKVTQSGMKSLHTAYSANWD